MRRKLMPESANKINTQRKLGRYVNEIKFYQNSTEKLIPRAPFGRLLREIFAQFGEFRTTPQALDAIQEAAEIFLVQMFEDAYRCTFHRGRVTLTCVDIELVRFIRGISDVGNQ